MIMPRRSASNTRMDSPCHRRAKKLRWAWLEAAVMVVLLVVSVGEPTAMLVGKLLV